MKPISKKRALIALAIIGGLYVLSRQMHWTGPRANVEFVPELLVPGVVLITLWGMWRLMGGSGA
jgi:hypothetical protein